jgi:hypothetical protein
MHITRYVTHALRRRSCPRMPQMPPHATVAGACPGMPRHAPSCHRNLAGPTISPRDRFVCAAHAAFIAFSALASTLASTLASEPDLRKAIPGSGSASIHSDKPSGYPESGSAPALRAAHAHPHSGTHSAAQTPRARSKNHPPGRMSPPPASPPDLPPEPAGPSTILVANLPSAMWAQHVGSRSEGRADGGG